MRKGEKIITVDFHKTKLELYIHYRNKQGDKKVRIKKPQDYPVFVPIDSFKKFNEVCGSMVRFVHQKKFYAYDKSTELLKVDMDAQRFLKKPFTSTKEKIIKKFNLFQADIRPEIIYMVENNLEFEKDLRLVYWDIETNGGLNVNNPTEEITSMAFYLQKLKKTYVFSWHPGMKNNAIVETDGVKYVICVSEEIMLQRVLRFIAEKFNYIDTLIGWNSSEFDVPYFINRVDILGMNRMLVSPLAKYAWTFKPKNVRYNKISGVNLLDYMSIYKSKGQYRKISPPNYKLKTIVDFEKIGLTKMEEFTWRDWMTNYKGFLGYQVRDVELLVKLEEKLQYIHFLFDFQDIVKLPLETLA